jgi:hypothetical protein
VIRAHDIDVRMSVARIALSPEDSRGADHDRLILTASNRGDETAQLMNCAILLPSGLRVFSDASHVTYPFALVPGMTVADAFEPAPIARLLADGGDTGEVHLEGVFFEDNRGSQLVTRVGLYDLHFMQPGITGIQHRADALLFEVCRWL